MLSEFLINPFTKKQIGCQNMHNFLQSCINNDLMNILDFKKDDLYVNDRKYLLFIFNLSIQLCDDDLKILENNRLQSLINIILNKNYTDTRFKKIELIIIFLHFLQFLFRQQNFIGPQNIDQRHYGSIQHYNIKEYKNTFYTKEVCNLLQVDDKVVSQIKILRIFEQSFILKKFHNYQKLTCVNGESIKENIKYLNLLILGKKIIKVLLKLQYDTDFPILNLYYARLNRYHGKVMQKPCFKLWKCIQKNYRKFIKNIRNNVSYQEGQNQQELFGLIKLEFALTAMYYYKKKFSKKLILETLSIFGLEVQFSGFYSIKIRKQIFVQKKCLVQVKPKRRHSFLDTEKEENQRLKKTQSLATNQPTVKKLSDIFDFILREKPKFDQFQGKKFNLKESIVIIGLISHVIYCNNLDILNKDNILQVLQQIIKNQKNWSLVLLALYQRSILEFSYQKKRERAVMQLEEIAKDIQFKMCDLKDRFYCLEFLDFPCFNDIICEISKFYIQNGCQNASVSFLQDYQLNKEALYQMYEIQSHENILKILKNITKKDYDSDIFCFLGKIQCNIDQYEQGIKISNKNSICCLIEKAKLQLQQKNYTDSLFYFQLAFSLNPMNLQALNFIGYIYWQQGNIQMAINFYSQSIEINDQQTDIYSNLSLIYRQEKLYKQSIYCIEKSLQIDNNRWKIFSNYAIICWEAQENNKMIRAIRKLVNLERQDLISDFLLRRLIEITSIKFIKKNDVKYINELQKQINNIVKRCEKVFQGMIKFMEDREFYQNQICLLQAQQFLIEVKNIPIKNFVIKDVNFEQAKQSLLQKQKHTRLWDGLMLCYLKSEKVQIVLKLTNQLKDFLICNQKHFINYEQLLNKINTDLYILQLKIEKQQQQKKQE